MITKVILHYGLEFLECAKISCGVQSGIRRGQMIQF